MSDYSITPARYAKNMFAIHCVSDGSGWKTRAMRIASALNGRWSNREKAYIVSRTKAAKFAKLYQANADADLGCCKDGTLGYVI